MLRTIAISLILLLSVGIMLPFANSAHGIRQSIQITQKKSKRYRSRAWWRRYRARLRAKRAAAELARRNALMALPQNSQLRRIAGDLSSAGGPALPALPQNAGTVSFHELPPTAMQADNDRTTSAQPAAPQPITVTNAEVPAATTRHSCCNSSTGPVAILP